MGSSGTFASSASISRNKQDLISSCESIHKSACISVPEGVLLRYWLWGIVLSWEIHQRGGLVEVWNFANVNASLAASFEGNGTCLRVVSLSATLQSTTNQCALWIASSASRNLATKRSKSCRSVRGDCLFPLQLVLTTGQHQEAAY